MNYEWVRITLGVSFRRNNKFTVSTSFILSHARHRDLVSRWIRWARNLTQICLEKMRNSRFSKLFFTSYSVRFQDRALWSKWMKYIGWLFHQFKPEINRRISQFKRIYRMEYIFNCTELWKWEMFQIWIKTQTRLGVSRNCERSECNMSVLSYFGVRCLKTM